MENSNTLKKIHRTRRCFFKNINKIDKTLSFTDPGSGMGGDNTWSTKIKNGRGILLLYRKVYKGILETILCNELDKLDEMDKFLESNKWSKLTQERKYKIWIEL